MLIIFSTVNYDSLAYQKPSFDNDWRFTMSIVSLIMLITVKRKYNDHLWDPEKVAVVQKVVAGQRLVKNFVVNLVGLWIQVVVVDTWPVFTGGR